MEYKEYELEIDSIDYVKKKLTVGGFFSKCILSKLNAHKSIKKIKTYLPVPTDAKQLYSFEWGGITSSKISENYLIDCLRNNSIINFLIIEELVAKKSDQAISSHPDFFFSIQNTDSIFWSLVDSSLKKRDKITYVLRLSNRYPFIAFSGNYHNTKLLKSNRITKEHASEVASSINYIVIGAYDEEGFIIVELV